MQGFESTGRVERGAVEQDAASRGCGNARIRIIGEREWIDEFEKEDERRQ